MNVSPPQVHGPDRTLSEAAEPAGADKLLQRPERVRLRGRVPAAAHLGLPAAGVRLLSELHRGRALCQGVLSAGGFEFHFSELTVATLESVTNQRGVGF